MVRFHARNGTVAMLPTTSTAPVEITEEALRGITAVRERQETQGAVVLGIHLEGPFISAQRLGAQAATPLEGDPVLTEGWASTYPIRVATVAPEIPGGLDVVRVLAKYGCRTQVGHSIASDEELRAGFSAGCTGFTHLFNAMTPVDHKVSGIAAYAMAYGTYAEIVSDLRHVHPTVMRAAYRAIPNLYAITDAVAVAGLEDGEHLTRGGRRTVVKSGTDVVLKSSPSTRAGSGITMIDAFRNLVSIGIALDVVSAMTSTRAADYLGVVDLGRIQPGFKASIVRLDHELRLEGVWVEGQSIELAAA
ncbi:N-acetylglucosamine-6-phosphate deacetylase [Microvirga aerophila]|uniref:N-acetylglucosamine-6-phosphate deacetylase n=2 Tax=Microvirga aerophila TaxID=670291 RepID=A0A512BTZ2_9HYPH|nr:N-acetylglucosamine-6-phosphate deacetylase [Microvirga aerophila]